MNREEAYNLLQTYVKQENMLHHSLASEAVMRALAVKLGRDEEKWGLAGLLHDIDVEITQENFAAHGLKAVEILRPLGVDEEVIEAILHHNECAAEKPRTKEFHYALAAGETITGLIFATTYVYPDKKLSSVKPKSVVKRMKEKKFAASVRRESILECEHLGISIDAFAELAINALLPISHKIGL